MGCVGSSMAQDNESALEVGASRSGVSVCTRRDESSGEACEYLGSGSFGSLEGLSLSFYISGIRNGSVSRGNFTLG